GVAGTDRRDYVVVPHDPGALVVLGANTSKRGRDDIDELIDEIFPDVEERPGWFDAALILLGIGTLGWAWIGEVPTAVTVVGSIALALGCILPARAAWRRVGRRREHRRREGLLAQGIPIDVSSPAASALVGAYEDLFELSSRHGPEYGYLAISAAHSALLEVASLLKGRSPTSDRELCYVDERATAVAELAAALGEVPTGSRSSDVGASSVDADTLIEAREELDRIAPFTSLTRLDGLIAEAKMQRRDRN
ncbi:MAG: hypothetical protein ABIP03_07855, partial [Aquihabitans sp.]